MEMLTKKKFDELAQVHQPHCVSIYIPTHDHGMEVNEQQDQILFKDKVKEVRNTLLNKYNLKEDQASKFLGPAYDLLDDSIFWHNTSKGLAFFMKPDGAEFYRMPHSFKEEVYISDHYYLRPLIPFFNGDGRFYVLGVSEKKVRLFQGSRDRIREVPLEEEIPTKIEDVVGTDHVEKTLQGRSVRGEGTGKILHGHGEGRDEDEKELEKFFRSLDKGISEKLHGEDAPLIVAGVDEVFSLYRKITHIDTLVDDHIHGNPDEMKEGEIHKKGWEILKEHFDKDKLEAKDRYNDLVGKGQATYDLGKIVGAAHDGRVSTLFINEDSKVFGVFDENSHKCQFHDEKRTDNDDLTDIAARMTFQQKGQVFLLSAAEMPDEGTDMNAILRY